MKSNFKILIVDDEVLITEFLKHVLQSQNYNKVELAHSKQQALQQLQSFKPNLVLLDIRMKTELEGIEIAQEINTNFKVPFIFITSHSDDIIIKKSIGVKPAGYLTKPIKQADVIAAVRIAEKQFAEANFITIKEGYNSVKLRVSDILYVKSDKNYIDIFTISQKYTVRNSLEWFLANAPGELFRRIHRSVVVNASYITKTTSSSVFINDIEIPVSRANQVDLN